MSGLGDALMVPAMGQHYQQQQAATLTPEGTLLAALGADLKHFWQPDAARVTLSGANVATMNDVAGAAPMALSVGAPIWVANGGPNNRPYIHLSTDSSLLHAPGVGIADGNRVGMYVVGGFEAGVGTQVLACTRYTDGVFPSAGTINLSARRTNAGACHGTCLFTGGTQSAVAAVAPDGPWHAFALRPLSAGASFQFDGLATSTPFTGSDTAQRHETCHIGHDQLFAGGKVACVLLVDLTTDAAAKDAAINAYFTAHFGLTIGASPPSAYSTLSIALGAGLLHFWEPDYAGTTFSGADVATLADSKGSATMAWERGSPVWESAGAPTGRPCIHLSVGATQLLANGVSIATGHRVGLYVVAKTTGAANTVQVAARAVDGISGAARAFVGGTNASSKFRCLCAFTGGTQDAASTVAADTNWHLFALRPLSTGASTTRDGVEQVPTFTGSDTVLEIETVLIGHTTLAAGRVAMVLAVDLSTDAVARDAAIRAYVNSRFGLAA